MDTRSKEKGIKGKCRPEKSADILTGGCRKMQSQLSDTLHTSAYHTAGTEFPDNPIIL